MVASERRIVNFNFFTPSMSTKHLNKHPADTVDDISRGRPSSHPSIGGPQSASPSPMDFFPLLEVNYMERLLTQNGIDIELDSTLDLNNQCSWADQADNRSPFPRSNVPSDQNKANTSNPVAHLTSINLAVTSANLEPFAIPYQADQPMDPILWDGSFSSISLFGIVKVLEGDTKNIACSLQRIATFIKQRPLGDRDGQDFP